MKDRHHGDGTRANSRTPRRSMRMSKETNSLGLFLLCMSPFSHCPTRRLSSSPDFAIEQVVLTDDSKRVDMNTLFMGAPVDEIDIEEQQESQVPRYLTRFNAMNYKSEKAIAPLVGSFSIEGQDPERYKINQDAYFDTRFCLIPPPGFPDDAPWCFTLAAVMDGHGSKGHILVDFLKDRLPERIEEQLSVMLFDPNQPENEDLQGIEHNITSLGKASDEDFYIVLKDPENNPMPTRQHIWRAMVRGFHLAQLDAMRDTKVATSLSGCTCIVALFNEKLQRVHVAHVGDSLAIKASVTSEKAAEANEDIVIVNAQSVCNTDLDRERERIEKSPDGRLDGVQTVCRAHLCVPMTRALGNTAMLLAGVLPTPIIEAVDLFEFHAENRETTPKYAARDSRSLNFLALCTDGVSDVMSNEEVVQTVGQVLLRGDGVQAASKAVAEQARRRWVEPFPIDPKVDDITCTIVLLPPPKPSARDFREVSDRVLDKIKGVIDVAALYADAYKQVSQKTEKAVKLGSGQHGEVWVAELSDGSDKYAIKLIDLDDESRGFQIAKGEQLGLRASTDLQRKARRLAKNCKDDEDSQRRWLRAAGNIVKYFHVAEDWSGVPEVCYVVMEYVEGRGLDVVGESLSDSQRLSVYIKLAEIIELLSTTKLGTHRSWVHRDIKLENVMCKVGEDGRVDIKLVDLGVIMDRNTRSKNFYLGTNWSWVPFEQRANPGNFAVCHGDCVSGFDMFSLGILISQLECGIEASRVISNPEDPCSDESKKIISDFFMTDLGKLAEQLTTRDPCERPRPPVLLDSLQSLYDKAKMN